jgi:type IV secretion system protein VirD4
MKNFNVKHFAIILIPFAIGFIGAFMLAGAVDVIPLPRIIAGAIGGGVFSLVAYEKRKDAKKWRHNVEYGSAKWGNREDIKPFVDPNPKNNVILTKTESLTMNSRPRPAKFARNKNILVIGGSGSGKTRFFAKPNIMQTDSSDYPVSLCVTDPKGQILVEMGDFLKNKQGYTIKVLNTIDFAKSNGYNPFAYIRSEKDILKFVTAFIANTKGEGKGGDDFWVKAETLLYQALIGYIFYELEPEERNINNLVEMINSMEVREDDENHKNAVDILFDELEEANPEHFAVRQYRKYSLAAGKTAKSILISCGARLSPFDIKEVRELMMYDELELDKLGGYHVEKYRRNKKTGAVEKHKAVVKRKTALFVIISDTDSSFNFIVSLMYSQLFNLLCDRADNDFDGRLPVHVRCILDEFANIGLIPNFEKLIATIRSREISVAVILQAQSQLKAIYKDNMDTIIGNTDTKLFLGGSEKTTLKEMEEILGKETVHMYNTSVTRGNQESHGQNYQKVGRSLMSTDEIAIMDGAKCILQVRGVRPFLSDKYDIEKHPNYKYLADADPSKAFDIAAFVQPFKKNREELLVNEEFQNINYNRIVINETPESSIGIIED